MAIEVVNVTTPVTLNTGASSIVVTSPDVKVVVNSGLGGGSGSGVVLVNGNGTTWNGFNAVDWGGTLIGNVLVNGAFQINWGTITPIAAFQALTTGGGVLSLIGPAFNVASTNVNITSGTSFKIDGAISTLLGTVTNVTSFDVQSSNDNSIISRIFATGGTTGDGQSKVLVKANKNLIYLGLDDLTALRGYALYTGAGSSTLRFAINEVGDWIANLGSDAIGDIYQRNGTNNFSRLASVATGNALISGGVAAVNSWGKIGLTTHVSGVLPLANGGTGVALTDPNANILYGWDDTDNAFTAITLGTNLLYTHATHTLSVNATTVINGAANNEIPKSNGVDLVPSGIFSTASGIFTTGTWNATKISEVYGGTNQTAYGTGDILYASGVNTLARRAATTNGFVLTLSGGIPVWASVAGTGTVTSVAWTTSQGVSASIATPTTTPNITITLGTLTGVTSINGLVITSNTGFVTTGTWTATAVSEVYGGTNQTSYTAGDILYASGANTLAKLPISTNGFVLTLSGGLPIWAAPTGGGLTNPMTTVGDIIQGTTAGAPVRLASVATGNALISGGVATLNSWGKITSAHIDATVQTAGLSWLLASGGTLTGVNTITSNAGNQLSFNGTWSAAAAADAHITFGGTLTAASALGVTGYLFNPTLNALGTSSVQVGLDVNPTFAGGTTPVNIGLRVKTGGVIIGNFSGFVVPATPDILLMRQDQNAQTGVSLINATSGTGAYTQFVVSSSATLATALLMRTFSAGFTSGGINVANTSVITSTTSGGFNIGTFTANQLSAWTNNVERARFLSTGEFLVGYTATTASEYFGIRKDVNSFTRVQIVNATSGTTAFTQFAISNSTTLATALTINTFSAGYTTSGLNIANSASLSSNMTAGFIIGTIGAQSLSFYTNSVKVLIIDGAGNTTLTQPGLSSAWLPIIAYTPGAHTSMTATAEFIDYDFKTRTATWLAGTTATQRFAYFRGQTVAGASASATFTDLYTVYIDPSVVGSNAVVTNNWALGLGGGLKLFAGTTTRPALVLPTGTNLTSSLAGAIENDGTHLWVTFANGGARAQLDNQVTSFGWALAGNTLVADGIIGDLGTGGFKISLYTNNTARQVIDSKGNFTFTQDAQSASHTFITFTQAGHTGGQPMGYWFKTIAQTGLTAPANTGFFFNIANSFSTQYVTGNFATWVSAQTQVGTISFVGASIITDAINFSVTFAPQASTNASITNSHGLYVWTTNVGAGVTNSYGITVNAMTGATNNYSAQFKGGIGLTISQAAQSTNHTFIALTQAIHTGGTPIGFSYTAGGATTLTANTEPVDITIALGRTVQFATGAHGGVRAIYISTPIYSFVGASTMTIASLITLAQAPIAGNNATITTVNGLDIQSQSVVTGSGIVTTSYGATISAMTGGANNYAARFLGGNVGIGLSAPLSTLDVSGSIGSNTRTISASATLAATDHTVLCDSTGGVVAATLPTASGAKGRIYVVKKIDASANNVTLATVDGGTKTITTRYSGFAVQSDGSLWYVIASF